MKVSGTTCTSPADARAKAVAGSTRGLLSPSPAESSRSCLPPEQGCSPDPEISAAHWSPGWSPGGQGLPTGGAEWDVLKWKGGLGEGICPNKQGRRRKKGLALWKGHICCSTGCASDNGAVNLTPESITSFHPLLSPATNIPPASHHSALLEQCWLELQLLGRGCCMSLLSLQRESKWLQKTQRERQENTQLAGST